GRGGHRGKLEDQARQTDDRRGQLAAAQAARDAKKYEKAVQLYGAAEKAAPADRKVEVLTGLARAERGRDQEQLAARRGREEQDRKAAFQKLLESGKANLTAGRFDAAVLALQEALKLNPTDADAEAALAQAQAEGGPDAQAKAEMQRKATEYGRLIGDGRRAMADKQYDAALRNFRDAQQVIPGDEAANRLVEEAKAALSADTQKRQEEARKA